MRRLNGITDSMDMSWSKLWEVGGERSLVCCSPWGGGHKLDKTATEQQHGSMLCCLSLFYRLKVCSRGPLAVPGLGPCASTAGHLGSVPGGRTQIPQAPWQGQKQEAAL